MPGLPNDAFREQVRSASDIVEVIGSYIPLKRAGANFVALCPFHKEKSPSFNVSPHRQIFHCFGCHKGGDVFRFVQDYENLTFPEALRRLAERAKIPIPETQGGGGEDGRHLKETLRLIHEQITVRWHTALLNDATGQIARNYLEQRGVPPTAVEQFRLGYSPDDWDDTVNWAKSKNHDLELVERAGLIIRKEGESRYYGRFRGRLMFPICDEQGRVIGFSGRVLKQDEKGAKYVNSPETPLFTKGRVIYGLDKAKRAMLDAGFAVICEGQLDLIACHMAGIQNVVAPQGTALTHDQIRILKRYVEEVVLCFDSDAAGQNATVRSMDDLITSGASIRVATIPAPHDPDSFIKEFGADAFQKRLKESRNFFDFYLDFLAANNDITTDRGRVALVRAMTDALRKTGSPVTVDTYLQKTAHRLGVSVETLRTEFKSHRPTPNTRTPDPILEAEPAKPVEPPPSDRERWFLRFLLQSDDLIPLIADNLHLDWIRHGGVRDLARRRIEFHQQGTWTGVASLVGTLDEGLRDLATAALADARPAPEPETQVKDLLTRLRNDAIDRELATLAAHLSSSASNNPDDPVYRRQLELRHLKKTPMFSPSPNPFR